MSGISTHILDISRGKPAARVPVTLEWSDGDDWRQIARQATDDGGRIKHLLPSNVAMVGGIYRLTFHTKEYFDRCGERVLYPVVQVTITVTDTVDHYHIPLLLTANGYSTYRGS